MQPPRTEAASYIVAVTRWAAGCTLEDELPLLLPALGLAPYDARLRLASPLPIVLTGRADLADAQSLVMALRARGHGVVACDAASVPAEESALVARGFELQHGAFVVLDRPGRAYALPWGELLGMFRAAEVSSEVETSEVVRQKLALGRAALTGGLMRRKSVTSVEKREINERQETLYVFRRGGPEPIVLRERELDYRGLGEQRGTTIHQSFTMLIDWLRQSAPHAIYDERLLSSKRRADLSSVQTGAGKQVLTSTNRSANQQAAFLLMHAHLQGQV